MKSVYILFICVFMAACATNEPDTSANSSAAPAPVDTNRAQENTSAAVVDTGKRIRIQSVIPYAKDNHIAKKIKSECSLNTNFANYLVSSAGNIKTADKLNKSASGQVLVMEIVDATSSGNAFIGHRKSATVRGTLYKQGKLVAGFTARRISGGGFLGGFKGSCSVLNRVMKAIASDISKWLASPIDGARLGDA